MTDKQQQLGALAEQYLDYLSGARDAAPDLAGLEPDVRREAQANRWILQAVWRAEEAYVPPPLAQDPLAVALGLVPDPGRRLDGKRLTQARKSRGLNAGQVADALALRGWDVTTSTVVRWEMASRADIAPALLTALADTVGVAEDRLVDSKPATRPADVEVEKALSSPRFARLAERWAAKVGTPLDAARASLQQTMTLATARRGDHLDAEQWLSVLEKLVEAGKGDRWR